MITLDSTLKSLEIKLAGAATTTELPFVASYADLSQATFALTGAGEQDGVTTGGTAVAVVSAPGAATSRKLNYLSVVNVDTAVAVLTVQVNNNATKRIVFKITLAVGDQLYYTDAGGFVIFDSSGNQKTTMQNAPLSITNAMLAGSIAASKLIATDFAAITMSGLLTNGAGIALTTDDIGIYQNTADGSDTRATWIAGGGLRNRSRGGYLYVTGNENGEPGIARFQVGNIAGSAFEIDRADGTVGLLMSNVGAFKMPNYGAGAATFDASGNITSVSDLRDKDVIAPYLTGLAALRHLQPIRFRWKAAHGGDRARTYVGFGAQDVLPWVPDAIDQHWLPAAGDPTQVGADRYTFNPIVILAALVNAVRALETRLDALDGLHEPDQPPTLARDLAAAIGFDARDLRVQADQDRAAHDVARRTGVGRFPVIAETRP